MASKTRLHILKTARQMFNEQGFGSVTNEMLAESCNIATGNLWYHFKTKRDLLDGLSENFVTDVEARISMRPTADGDVIEEYAAMLRVAAEEIRHYRFLYRDQADYGAFTDTLLSAIPRIYSNTFDQFRAFLQVMIEKGLLKWDSQRLEDLVTVVIMILRYHLEFQRELGDAHPAGSGAVTAALSLHLVAFEHRLTPSSAKRLRATLLQQSVE